MTERQYELEVIPDHISEAFWNGAAAGELVLQRCSQCVRLQHPPGPICRHCGGNALSYEPVSGDGVVYSLTRIEQTPLPIFRNLVPYYVALVELSCQPGLRILSCVEKSQLTPEIGSRVETVFRDPGYGRVIPLFRVVRDS